MLKCLRYFISNHLPLTAVGLNPVRDFGFFFICKNVDGSTKVPVRAWNNNAWKGTWGRPTRTLLWWYNLKPDQKVYQAFSRSILTLRITTKLKVWCIITLSVSTVKKTSFSWTNSNNIFIRDWDLKTHRYSHRRMLGLHNDTGR
jgi:hypothetical protein